jgi:hypothetical protein
MQPYLVGEKEALSLLSLSKLIIGTVYNPIVLCKYYSRKGLCWPLFAGVRSVRRKRRGQGTFGQRPSRNQLNGVGRHRKPLSRGQFAGTFSRESAVTYNFHPAVDLTCTLPTARDVEVAVEELEFGR